MIDPSINKGSPKVSALVSVYKAEAFLDGCLKALVEQSLYEKGKLEILIVDACSPEDERTIVERHQSSHPNIHYIRTDRRIGLYAAWNLAADSARGEYLLAASADDRLYPNIGEALSALLDQCPSAAFAYGDWDHATLDDLARYDEARIQPNRRCRAGPFSRSRMLRCFYFGSQLMWRRSLHTKIGGFDQTYKIAGDYDFLFRLLESGHEAAYLEEPTGVVTKHDRALSSQAESTAKERSRALSNRLKPDALTNMYRADGYAGSESDLIADFMSRCLIENPPWREGKLEIFLDSYNWASNLAREWLIGEQPALQSIEAAKQLLFGENVADGRLPALALLRRPHHSERFLDEAQRVIPEAFYAAYFGNDQLAKAYDALQADPQRAILVWGTATKGALASGWLKALKRDVEAFIDSFRSGTFQKKPILPPEALREIERPTAIILAMNPSSHAAALSEIKAAMNSCLTAIPL